MINFYCAERFLFLQDQKAKLKLPVARASVLSLEIPDAAPTAPHEEPVVRRLGAFLELQHRKVLAMSSKPADLISFSFEHVPAAGRAQVVKFLYMADVEGGKCLGFSFTVVRTCV